MKNTDIQSFSNGFTSKKSLATVLPVLYCIAGSIFLALMAQLSIDLPFSPVPITMQTLGVFLLVVMQGRAKATYSVLLYLMQATMGLPVLAGGIANPAWMLFPTAGYLIGFLGCTLVAGILLEKKENPGFTWILFSLVCGQAVIYTVGASVLAFFVGVDKALPLGVAPFLQGAFLKVTAAACAAKPVSVVTKYFLGK